jgi:hypothetical protein
MPNTQFLRNRRKHLLMINGRINPTPSTEGQFRGTEFNDYTDK